jgi:uncharacterized protein with PIN domain
MVIDTSALVAILLREPDFNRIIQQRGRELDLLFHRAQIEMRRWMAPK